jgi:hypothetical protein
LIIALWLQRLKPLRLPLKPNSFSYALQAAEEISAAFSFFHDLLRHNGRQTSCVHRSLMADSVSTRNAPSELFEGGYYSIIDGDTFSIAKVLKLEPEIVHVRIYKQHFPQRPRSIDPAALTLGTIHDKDGFGMGHLPLRLATFMDSEPMFLTHAQVTPEELEGYNLWKESSGGGVWE